MAVEFEEITRQEKNILANTMEQTLLTIGSQLVLIAFASPKMLLNYIPFMNICFVVGRIAFWAGYPKYRAFGFCLSFIPSAFAIKLCWFSALGISKWLHME